MHQTAAESITAPAATQHERRYLRLAGYVGLFPFLAMIGDLTIGRIPWPDNNLPGRAYLSYLLAHRTDEIQSLTWACVLMAMLLFFLLLGAAYMQRAARLTASGMAMIIGMTIFTAVALASVGSYLGIALWARGDPSFGSSPGDIRLATFVWGADNMITFLCVLPTALTWTAVVAANRADPLLPRVLGGWCAGAVAAVNVGCLGFAFADTGRWSPISTYEEFLQMGPVFVWTIVAAVALLRSTSKAGRAG